MIHGGRLSLTHLALVKELHSSPSKYSRGAGSVWALIWNPGKEMLQVSSKIMQDDTPDVLIRGGIERCSGVPDTAAVTWLHQMASRCVGVCVCRCVHMCAW